MADDQGGNVSTISDVVPLPDSLKACGCRFAPTTHATTCATAIAFDAIPLTEREEYEDGRRFAAVSWDFPLRITARIEVEVSLDPVAVILANADEYERWEPEADYADWEKPVAWLAKQVEEQCDLPGVWFGSRRLSRDRTDIGEIEEYPRWTAEDTARVDAALARRVDPNQGALEV